MITISDLNFKEFEIGVGQEFDGSNFVAANFQTCIYKCHKQGNAARKKYICRDGPILGRYVAVYIVTTKHLKLCEVDVLGRKKQYGKFYHSLSICDCM